MDLAGTVAAGVHPDCLQAEALAMPSAIPSVTSSAAMAMVQIPRMTWRRHSLVRPSCTGRLCNFRDRRSTIHLHSSDPVTGPSMIFPSARGSCSCVPGPGSDLTDARASVFRTAAFSDDSMAWPQTDAGPMPSSGAADFPTGAGSSEDAATHNGASGEMKDGEPPVTLLQLRDGSMYGLVDYWVEDGRLHYKTTYGAQNSIELDRIDLEQTVHLNADRGVQFMLRPKHPSASVPPAGQTSN
jgi:hypothetical protein